MNSFSTDYEEFTPQQEALLDRYVTNTRGSIFALRNLPEVIKGALFSRYSRSALGLRSLLLKEFIQNSDETGFQIIAQEVPQAEEQLIAIKKAQNFYDRILDGYGDDSIGELGGAHLAIENISMLAAKGIEDSRIGGSPLEKSTRYIYFDQKVKGEYLFYREPVLMTSAYRDLYLNTCNMLFDTYSSLIPPLTEYMERNFPKSEEVSKAAYSAAIRAKVLDCVRGLLPASTLTNMGMFGNGRFFEYLLHKLHVSPLVELQDIGKRAYEELSKVIPSFVRRADMSHRHCQAWMNFAENMRDNLAGLSNEQQSQVPFDKSPGVRLVASDPDGKFKVAAALLYPYCNRGYSELLEYVRKLPEDELAKILDGATSGRQNRRHKSPRATENAAMTFEVVADFGAYRDLQRHRVGTQDRQLLTCDLGYVEPFEIEACGLAGRYREALDKAKEAFDLIAKELPEEAQYIVPMAYNIRWYFTSNLRSLQWMCELRSIPQGHAAYRAVAQQMARLAIENEPAFERFFSFVDYSSHDIGRLEQEERAARKKGVTVS